MTASGDAVVETHGAGNSALLPKLLARCEGPAAAEFIRAEETIMHAALPRESGASC